MRSSDSFHFNIPKSINYANSDSSPFNSDESLSAETSSHNDSISLSLPKPIIPSTTTNYDSTNPSSNDSSPIKLHDNPTFKKIIKTHQTNPRIDRSRHPSQNLSMLPHPPIDRTTKTHFILRHQPKMDYRLFIPPSKL